jgi:hypothetical protein
LKAKTRKNPRKLKSVTRVRTPSSHIGDKAEVGNITKKRADSAVPGIQKMDTLVEKLTYLAEFAKGRIQFIPATKTEAAHIIIPPDLDEEIRKTIHLSDFLHSNKSDQTKNRSE